jgi:hypothetical protein
VKEAREAKEEKEAKEAKEENAEKEENAVNLIVWKLPATTIPNLNNKQKISNNVTTQKDQIQKTAERSDETNHQTRRGN